MSIKVRPARIAEADAISRVILAALRTSNARDYPVSVIERVQSGFGPGAIERFMLQRQCSWRQRAMWWWALRVWRGRSCARYSSTLTGIGKGSGVY